ncbi:MAG: response regulator transcription factor [Bacteroidota bacterium]
MTRYIIIDDESIAHEIIKGYADMLPNLKLMHQCYDALEAIEYLSKHPIDLIFLDLNMPKLKGFQFLKTLTDAPKVIVTTAYKEYALEGYELNISDYLLKPFSFERFLKAVNKATIKTREKSTSTEIHQDQDEASIFLRSNKKYTQIRIADIMYLESAGNYVKVVTSKESVMVRDKISNLLTSLENDNFIRIHKSFVVSKIHIKSVEGNRVFLDEYAIPIGKTYRNNLLDMLT